MESSFVQATVMAVGFAVVMGEKGELMGHGRMKNCFIRHWRDGGGP